MYNSFNHIYIMITHGCNFACEYCFNHDIGQTKISFEQARKAIDILVSNSSSNELSISFFGGEPLLGMDVISQVKKYCRETYPNKHWGFGATTNFSNLTKEVWEEVILDKDFSLLVSLDGNSFHNRHRVLKDGSPTFDIVMNNISKIKDNEYLNEVWKRFQIRCTFPASDIDSIYDRTMFLLNNIGTTSYVIMNVDEDDWTNVSYEKYREQILKVIAEAEKRKNPDIIKNIKFFYDSMISYKNRLLNINMMEKSCGQAFNQFAVDYTGNLSPCHRFTNINMHTDKWVIGNVDNGLNEEKINAIRSYDSEKINSCKEKGCKRFSNCAFGCFASGVSCSSDYSAQCNGQHNMLFNMFEYNNRIIEELLNSGEDLPVFYWLFGFEIKQRLLEEKIKTITKDNEKLKEIVGKIIPMLDFMGNKLDK